MDAIKIEDLLQICAYGTHINVKLSDTGRIAIDGVSAMSNSKDKRQKAKWEAFKNKPVYFIEPSVDTAWMKRGYQTIGLTITASIHRLQYDIAMKEYEDAMKTEGR